jgi:hypothetical protein
VVVRAAFSVAGADGSALLSLTAAGGAVLLRCALAVVAGVPPAAVRLDSALDAVGATLGVPPGVNAAGCGGGARGLGAAAPPARTLAAGVSASFSLRFAARADVSDDDGTGGAVIRDMLARAAASQGAIREAIAAAEAAAAAAGADAPGAPCSDFCAATSGCSDFCAATKALGVPPTALKLTGFTLSAPPTPRVPAASSVGAGALTAGGVAGVAVAAALLAVGAAAAAYARLRRGAAKGWAAAPSARAAAERSPTRSHGATLSLRGAPLTPPPPPPLSPSFATPFPPPSGDYGHTTTSMNPLRYAALQHLTPGSGGAAAARALSPAVRAALAGVAAAGGGPTSAARRAVLGRASVSADLAHLPGFARLAAARSSGAADDDALFSRPFSRAAAASPLALQRGAHL